MSNPTNRPEDWAMRWKAAQSFYESHKHLPFETILHEAVAQGIMSSDAADHARSTQRLLLQKLKRRA